MNVHEWGRFRVNEKSVTLRHDPKSIKGIVRFMV